MIATFFPCSFCSAISFLLGWLPLRIAAPGRGQTAPDGYSGKVSGWKAYAHIDVGSIRMKTTPSPHSNGLEP